MPAPDIICDYNDVSNDGNNDGDDDYHGDGDDCYNGEFMKIAFSVWLDFQDLNSLYNI